MMPEEKAELAGLLEERNKRLSQNPWVTIEKTDENGEPYLVNGVPVIHVVINWPEGANV
jgi:hypothetical protein